ncbi:hypothetical protein DFH06DRAFT_1230591 [Mycena polygramma]|nr:hypothetical protein DFH06DRAFT_1230591 [Mycena polygramma]
MHVLPPYPEFPKLIGPMSPTPLTQICRKWRETASSTPQLWRVISSHVPSGTSHMFRLWLERSRCCPLYLKLGTSKAGASSELMKAVVPHRARLEYLKTKLSRYDHHLFDGPMPLLRRLDLFVHEEKPLQHDLTLREVPLLRTVVLNDEAVSHMILPWTQLTSLTLLRVFPSECVPVLLQTYNLVHCRLGVCFEGRNAEPRPDITLPSLETLTLRNHNTSFPVTDVFPSFIVPALRSLEIPEGCLQLSPIDSLTAFVSRSECRLEQLHVTGVTSAPESSYGQAFPSLRKLSFGEDIEPEGDFDFDDSSADSTSDDDSD